MIISEICV